MWGLAAGLALSLLATGGAPAIADPGDARATALRASLNGTILGVDVNLLDETLSHVEVSQGDEDAEAEETLLSLDVPGLLLPVLEGEADVVSSTASSNHVRALATSFLEELSLSSPVLETLGLPTILTLDSISASALCHIVEAPVGQVEPPVEAFLLGVMIDVELETDIEVTLPVGIGSATAVVRFGDIEETADTAAATGASLSLEVTVLGIVDVSFDVTIADTACERGIPEQPFATALDPDSGPAAGGTEVTVTGDKFVPGFTAVNIGPNTVPASEVVVLDDTTLQFTTPPHVASLVEVTVKTPGGATAPPLGFEYLGGVGQPIAEVISPDRGPETGGTLVTITGDNFVPGQTVVNIGTTSVPADQVDVLDSMTLQFITPPHAPGVVDVVVKTPGGASEPPLAFEYEAEDGVDERVPVGLEVDFSPVISDGNDIFEPGERVLVAPEWLNDGPDTLELTGTAADFTGPAGPMYTLVDQDADYGTVKPGAIASCRDTGMCYAMEVGPEGVARPAQHWDTTFDETLSDGTTYTWTLHIGDTFLDMPRVSLFYPFVETIVHNAITGGCTVTEYCPTAANTRAQMAVFVLRSFEGPDFVPQPAACTAGAERFDDVPASSIFCPWVEELARRNVVGGCGGNNYCPNDPVSRAQMSIFLLRTLEGAGFTPPPCSGIFDDVPCPSAFADWIEDLFQREITAGCSTVPSLYCPTDPVTRQQMAVFLTRTYGLLLYGP